MGTRHLTIVKSEGRTFGQYGKGDGYPEGAGKDVLHFIKTRNLEVLAAKMRTLTFLTDADVAARWKACGADDTGFVNMDISSRFKEKNAHLSRDMGADILNYILDAEAPEVNDSLVFAVESLFCEWAWMLDLDTQTLRCFKGFNKEPLSPDDFFYYLKSEDPDGYQPIREVKSFTFDECQTLTPKSFVEEFVEEGEE